MKQKLTGLTILRFGALATIAGCGDLVRPNDVLVPDGQRQVDAISNEDTLRDRPTIDRPSAIVDAASDGMDVEVATWDVRVLDVMPLPSACDGGECTPPDAMPLPNTNQSCRGPNGAPAEHCREVWASGGPFVMGSRRAMKLPYRGVWRPQEDCDVAPGVVHPGYVDAYPASVARFRAFVRAGQPRPPIGAVIFNGFVWDRDLDMYVATDRIRTDQNDFAYCSYRDRPGEHDDLPMNCLTIQQMMAFCYWDGKHYATEPTWEFVATNGGTTTRPFVPPAEWNFCEWGDVSYRGCRPGTSELPLPITSFPQAQTFSPAGLFGLWGGPSTYLIRSRVVCGENFVDGWVQGQNVNRSMMLRGTSNLYDLSDADVFRMGQSRSYVENPDFSYGDMGIRCMRWLPESRE